MGHLSDCPLDLLKDQFKYMVKLFFHLQQTTEVLKLAALQAAVESWLLSQVGMWEWMNTQVDSGKLKWHLFSENWGLRQSRNPCSLSCASIFHFSLRLEIRHFSGIRGLMWGIESSVVFRREAVVNVCMLVWICVFKYLKQAFWTTICVKMYKR